MVPRSAYPVVDIAREDLGERCIEPHRPGIIEGAGAKKPAQNPGIAQRPVPDRETLLHDFVEYRKWDPARMLPMRVVHIHDRFPKEQPAAGGQAATEFSERVDRVRQEGEYAEAGDKPERATRLGYRPVRRWRLHLRAHCGVHWVKRKT